MFVIGHPRSGSANLVKYLALKLSETNTTWNLDEIFYTKCFQLWGEFSKTYNKDFDYNQQLLLYSLKTDIDFKNQKSGLISSKVRDIFYDKSQITFTSATESVEFYEKEFSKRLNFLNILENQNFEYVVKYFFENDNRQEIKFLIDQSIILYRKNISEAIYSAIIKVYYYKKYQTNSNFIDHYNNGQRFLVPFYQIDLNEIEFEKFLYPHIELIKFIKENPEIFSISYEDIYHTDKNLCILYKSKHIYLDRSLLGQAITYSSKKTAYFPFQEKYQEIFSKTIQKNNLTEVCDRYQINFY